MDAAKVMRLLYLHPEVTSMDDLKTRFMDITKRVFPSMQNDPVGGKSKMSEAGGFIRRVPLVCIPTTSGTGSEVTPFAVITDDAMGATRGTKYPLVDYFMTPDIAIVDPQLAYSQPKSLLAPAAYDAMSHAVESLFSVMASEFTIPLSLQAAGLINAHLPSGLRGERRSIKEVHLGATIAGMAFSNAFLGVGHALAHQLGGHFHLPHGVCCALVLPAVVRYNAVNAPRRHAVFPQYAYVQGLERAAMLSDHWELEARNASLETKRDAVVAQLAQLRKQVGLPATLREAGINTQQFKAALPAMVLGAIDDQVIGTNPRAPFLEELKALFEEVF